MADNPKVAKRHMNFSLSDFVFSWNTPANHEPERRLSSWYLTVTRGGPRSPRFPVSDYSPSLSGLSAMAELQQVFPWLPLLCGGVCTNPVFFWFLADIGWGGEPEHQTSNAQSPSAQQMSEMKDSWCQRCWKELTDRFIFNRIQKLKGTGVCAW